MERSMHSHFSVTASNFPSDEQCKGYGRGHMKKQNPLGGLWGWPVDIVLH